MFSQTVEYGLRAAVALARQSGEPLTGKEISDRTQVPSRYLTKVLSYLIRAELVHGSRGVGGGYTLAAPAEQISLLDVVNAVEPIRRITTCPLQLSQHSGQLCALHRQLDEAIAQTQDVLARSTLADLAGNLEGCRSMVEVKVK
jgi:Rrf2 family protein